MSFDQAYPLRRTPTRRWNRSLHDYRRKFLGTKLLLLVPAVVLFLLMTLIPLAISVSFSFTNWDGLSQDYDWIGWDNYSAALKDESSRQALVNTLIIAGVGTAVANLLGISLAFTIERLSRGRTLYRALLFFPIMLSPLITGFLWRNVLGDRGVFNTLFASVGGGTVPFLTDSSWALMSVTGVFCWQVLGLIVLIYSAAIQNLPVELDEAAEIDGASRWQIRRRIHLPLLVPAIALNVVVVLTWALREYDRVVSLTGGGPAGSSQTFLYRIMYEGFERYHFGYSQAQTVMLVLFSALLGFIVLYSSRAKESDV